MFQRHAPAVARLGISTIEMTIVVLVTGILASVGAPRYFESLAHYQIDAAARLTAMDLRMARDHAMKTSSAQTVDFDPTTETYAVPTMPDPDRPSVPYVVQLSSRYSVVVHSAVFGSADQVQFDMYGKPTNSGSVVLRAGSRQRTIEVDAAGNVRIL